MILFNLKLFKFDCIKCRSHECCSTAEWPLGALESLFTGGEQLAARAGSVELNPEADRRESLPVASFFKKKLQKLADELI